MTSPTFHLTGIQENIKIIIELNKTDKFLGETSSRSIIYRKGIFEGMGYTYKLLDIADYI